MSRITPEMVRQAYEKTGWRPINKVFIQELDGATCGCPISVLCVEQSGDGGQRYRADLFFRGVTDALRPLGLPDGYIDGFVAGVDFGRPEDIPLTDSDYISGFQDGWAVAEAFEEDFEKTAELVYQHDKEDKNAMSNLIEERLFL